ncbi:hypothetical protein KFE25_008082 [Diacronema lutheri]|uniref:Uncharacterized protein n=1 Tax=Diacronema lutheri TaxID=2081491 RepID=A0A8J6CGH3_DIALT|nr:hypothetical protein KFE25_008082 [Diacronema lutheri]
MLYAHKNELHARLSRDLISVRSRELDYYTTNIRNIGFSAALLTGFAFGTLANHKSSDMLDWLVPYAEEFEGVDIQPPFILLSDFAINGLQRLQVTLEVAYLVSNITAMGLTIYTLYVCLLLSITGPGLALRGPEGSVDRAVFLLARGCRRVIQAFAFSLYLFMVSIFFKAFLSYHIYLAVICALFLIYYMYAIRRHAKGVLRMFRIDRDQVQTGRFEVETGAGESLGNHDLFPTIVDLLQDMYHAAVNALRRTQHGPDEANDPELHRPSVIAADLVGLHQSPHLDLNDSGALSQAGGLDGWFSSTFGTDHIAAAAHAKLKNDAPRASSTQGSDTTSSSSCTCSAATNGQTEARVSVPAQPILGEARVSVGGAAVAQTRRRAAQRLPLGRRQRAQEMGVVRSIPSARAHSAPPTRDV